MTNRQLRGRNEYEALIGTAPEKAPLAIVDEVLSEHGIARPAQLHRVQLSDHETVVAERGEDGPRVVLVHALGLDWRMWESVVDQLAAGRRAFAYDIRGR